MSTFLVECDAATWQAYGFADKTIEESQAICEARVRAKRSTATG